MELKRGSLRQRVLSGIAVGCFGALVVVLGGGGSPLQWE